MEPRGIDKELDANVFTPTEIIKATVYRMAEREFGRVVNKTASAGKSPIPSLVFWKGASSGLTEFAAGLAPQQ